MAIKLYWLAHVRGADFVNLHRLGFVSFFPVSDDYVFLEAVEANKKLVSRQLQLGLEFLAERGKLATVTQAELDQMGQRTPSGLKPGDRVVITDDVFANLEGEVVALGETLRVRVRGWTRTYDVDIARTKVLPLIEYSYEVRSELG